MVNFTVSMTQADLEKRLGQFRDKAPDALKKALNQTAKDAQKKLLWKAKATYAVQAGGFKSRSASLKIKNATKANLTAQLSSTGAHLSLTQFKVKTGASGTSAKAIKANSLKAFKVEDRWAFVVKFKSGHKAFAQRVTSERLPLRTFSSLAIPQMIGNEERVYGEVEPDIEEWLTEHVEEQIIKLMKEA